MDDPLEPTPPESVEASVPRLVKYKKHLLIGGGVFLLLLVNAIALYLLSQRMLPQPVVPAIPIATIQPPVVTKEQLAEAARQALLKKKELIELHRRILDKDASGFIDDLRQVKQLVKKIPAKPVPAPLAEISGTKPTPQPESIAPSPKLPAVAKEKIEKKLPPTLTPMGGIGYGVSKDNIEGLTSAIDEMNRVGDRKEKKR